MPGSTPTTDAASQIEIPKTNTIGGKYKYQILTAISYSKGWSQLQQPNTEIYFKLQMPWSYVNSQVFLAVNLVFGI